MLFSMLDPRFKNSWLVSSFIGRKQNVSIVEYYDMQSLFSMLLKCHHMTKYEYMANQLNVEDSNLDIKKMIARTNRPTKELQMFKRYQIDAFFWNGGGNMNPCFQLMFSLLAKFLTS